MSQTDWSAYLNKTISCDCSREHSCNIGHVIISANALIRIPELLDALGCKSPCLVSDVNTDKAAGEQVTGILSQAGYSVRRIVFPDKELVPDERAVGTILTKLEPECDLLLAIGSGTINDLCRFVASRLRIRYFIIATAPSMDGYASSISPLISDSIKTTFPSIAPGAIVGDTEILRCAPMEMIAAGVADVLGKYVCLADWKISHIINGEYICPYVVSLVERNLESVVSVIGKVKDRDSDAIAKVMDTLVLSGMVMSYIGNSRPASGSEHHLAHYWETVRLFGGKHDILHGTNVGIATLICLAAYKKLAELLPLLKYSSHCFNMEEWTLEIEKAYGSASKSIIELEKTAQKNNPVHSTKRAQSFFAHRDEICDIIQALPQPEYVAGLLNILGAPCTPTQVDVDMTMLKNSLYYAKDLRNRFGLLQLLYDLNIQEDMFEHIRVYIN